MKRKRNTKPKLVLLDANIIIEAHELGIWQDLIQRADIYVPSIVVRDEAIFYSKAQNKNLIDLPMQVREGKIKELHADNSELDELTNKFTPGFAMDIHAGEAEALAVINSNTHQDLSFCTSDAMAIKALAMIGLKHKGISMETLINSIGITKQLKKQFTEIFFRSSLKQGAVSMIQGQGLLRDE